MKMITRQKQLEQENELLLIENDSLRQAMIITLNWIRCDMDSIVRQLPQAELEAMVEAVLYNGIHAVDSDFVPES